MYAFDMLTINEFSCHTYPFTFIHEFDWFFFKSEQQIAQNCGVEIFAMAWSHLREQLAKAINNS